MSSLLHFVQELLSNRTVFLKCAQLKCNHTLVLRRRIFRKCTQIWPDKKRHKIVMTRFHLRHEQTTLSPKCLMFSDISDKHKSPNLKNKALDHASPFKLKQLSAIRLNHSSTHATQFLFITLRFQRHIPWQPLALFCLSKHGTFYYPDACFTTICKSTDLTSKRII